MRRTKTTLFVLAVAVIVLLVFVGPILRLARTAYRDRNVIEKLPAGYVDDVSRMNKARVAETWDIPSNPQKAEEQLRDLLERARASGLHVSIAGARHSMGGQTIYPGGIAINMLPFKAMELDEGKNLLHVQAGAKWADVIPYLDKHGRSIEVMQSDNSFTVGGSLSVNCHGWQYGRPPIASTVESFRLMKADGSVVRCSRSENKELFSLALGGYGLFGVILDADLRVVPNERLRLEQYIVPLDQAMESFERKLREKPGVRMVYARMNITPQRMFDEVLVNMFYPEGGPIPLLTEAGSRWLPRVVFRGSASSAYGKELRWSAETKIQPYLIGRVFSRNQLMNDNAEWYLDHSADTTDILHEYFLRRQSAGQFLTAARRIMRKHSGNLLNVTVRDVEIDSDTFLRYATQPMIAFGMFFSQPRNVSGDAQMQEMTQLTRWCCIDRLSSHGTYPYFTATFVTTSALLYPAFRSLHLEAPLTQSFTPLDSLLFNVILATLAIGLPILVVLSIRFLWDRNLNLGRSKELEKLIWQLHRIASVMEHQMNLSFPAVQPGTKEPRDLAYLQQLAAQPNAATPSDATPSAAAPTPATDQPTVQPPVTPPPADQQASLPALERRAPSAEAPRAGVNSMFGL